MRYLLTILLCVCSFLLKAEDLLPLNVGEVFVRGTNLAWKFRGGTKDDSTKLGNSISHSLIYRAETGNGEFIAARKFENLDCSGFDKIILLMNAGGNRQLSATLTATTDKGDFSSKTAQISGRGYGSSTELAVDLHEAKQVKALTLNIQMVPAGKCSAAVGLFAVILRKDAEYQAFINHYKRFEHVKWQGLLMPESYKPEFKLRGGLFFNDREADDYRKKYASALGRIRNSVLKYRNDIPEKLIYRDFFTTPAREYQVERYKEVFGVCAPVMYTRAPSIAYAGYISKDKKLLRLAARYALAMASFNEYTDYPAEPFGFVSDDGAFLAGRVGASLAFVYDCAGEMLNSAGRNFVLRSMMLKICPPVSLSFISRPFTWQSNQGMSFGRGKVASLLLAEKIWPRTKAYLNIAVSECNDCMNHIFRPAGSYMESCGYLNYTIGCSSPVYEMLAAVQKKKLCDVLPDGIKKSGLYVQAVCSTNRSLVRKLIPVGQSYYCRLYDANAIFMAAAVPDSRWVNIYQQIPEATRKKIFRSGGDGYGLRMLHLDNIAKANKGCDLDDFVLLKDCALLASQRKLNGEMVKLLLIGDAIGLGKKHDDVGSFVLEFAGDTFAEDLPLYAGLFTHSEYHNCLVPVLDNEQLGNPKHFTDPDLRFNAKARNSQRPEGSGDGKSLKAQVDTSKCWNRKYFERHVRKVASPSPDKFVITDEYKLGSAAKGVAFIWITALDAKISGNKVVIAGKKGSVEITVPAGCRAKVEKFNPGAACIGALDLPKGSSCSRIIIARNCGKNESGALTTKIRLIKTI